MHVLEEAMADWVDDAGYACMCWKEAWLVG